MTLGTHAIVGATLGAIAGNPAGAFVIGFLSHFLLDAIPHWDYKLGSFEEPAVGVSKLETKVHFNKTFIKDLFKISLDVLIGIIGASIIAYFATKNIGGLFAAANITLLFSVAFGAIGGMLPDPLQLAYYVMKREPLTSLQKFHIWIHTDIRLKGSTQKEILGVISQIVLVLIVSSLFLLYLVSI